MSKFGSFLQKSYNYLNGKTLVQKKMDDSSDTCRSMGIVVFTTNIVTSFS